MRLNILFVSLALLIPVSGFGIRYGELTTPGEYPFVLGLANWLQHTRTKKVTTKYGTVTMFQCARKNTFVGISSKHLIDPDSEVNRSDGHQLKNSQIIFKAPEDFVRAIEEPNYADANELQTAPIAAFKLHHELDLALFKVSSTQPHLMQQESQFLTLEDVGEDSTDLKGYEGEIVGFGSHDSTWNRPWNGIGKKRVGYTTIESIWRDYFSVKQDPNDATIACKGDSGGPWMLNGRVYGITSFVTAELDPSRHAWNSAADCSQVSRAHYAPLFTPEVRRWLQGGLSRWCG